MLEVFCAVACCAGIRKGRRHNGGGNGKSGGIIRAWIVTNSSNTSRSSTWRLPSALSLVLSTGSDNR